MTGRVERNDGNHYRLLFPDRADADLRIRRISNTLAELILSTPEAHSAMGTSFVDLLWR